MVQKRLQQIATQTVTVSIKGTSFTLVFFVFRNLQYVSITHDQRRIVTSKRVMANQWLIPDYEATGAGNIRFETYVSDGDDYVWYEGFNTKFRLMVYTEEEIRNLEGA